MSGDLVERLREDDEMLRDGYQINLTLTWHTHAMQQAAKDCIEAANRIEADTKLIQEMREALQRVEDRWLQDEMKNHNGAPYAIFAARAALSKAKSQQEGETE